jgi:hypothetical protein
VPLKFEQSRGTKLLRVCLSISWLRYSVKTKGRETMLAFALSCLVSFIFLQESIGSDFNDLGRKLLGGFVVAVAFAITFTIVRLRLRDKKPPAAFISITSSQSEEAAPKAGGD